MTTLASVRIYLTHVFYFFIQAFSSEELNCAKRRVEQLSGYQKSLDDCWRGIRWTMDIITTARDKSIRGGLPLSVLYAPPPSSPKQSPDADRKLMGDVASSVCSDAGYHSDWSVHLDGSSLDRVSNTSASSLVGASHVMAAARSSQSKCSSSNNNNSSSSSISINSTTQCDCDVSSTNNICSVHTARTQRTQQGTHESSPQQPQSEAPTSGILRVHTAYDTGLAHGTNVKLQVTPTTTSREVINLVVQQLNKAVLSKGLDGPVYDVSDMCDFCLVAVIGARERVLRDDFQPLHLQNPWTKGRLYVRLRTNLLAALEHGQVTNV